MGFTVDTFDLSMRDSTGKVLTANVYYVDGIPTPLSIGQLVMAICLERAVEKEAEVVKIMNRMNATTVMIEDLARCQEKIQDKGTYAQWTFESLGYTADELPWKVITDSEGKEIISDQRWALTDYVTGSSTSYLHGIANSWDFDGCLNGIDTKLDEYNTLSQEEMILLQSETNKRDRSYDMITNILKSFHTVMTGIVNNF